jgi:hypothetical protein
MDWHHEHHGGPKLMNVEMFSFCTSAVLREGRLTVHGAYTHVEPPSLPAILGSPVVAVRIRFDCCEKWGNELAVSLMHPNGNALGQLMPERIEVNRRGEHSHAWFQSLMSLPDIVLDEPGPYTLQLVVDGQLAATCVLSVQAGEGLA